MSSRDWLNVTLCFAITSISWGTHYSYGLFLKPIISELHWERSAVSVNFSITLLGCGIFSILMGRLADKYDIRKVVAIGGIFLGTGLLLSSTIQSKWQIFIFYGLMIGIGLGAGYVPLVTFLSRNLTHCKGLGLGITAAGIGFGTFAMSQLIAYLLPTLGWRATFGVLSLMNFSVISMASAALRSGARQFQKVSEIDESTKKQKQNFRVGDAMRTNAFWILFFCYLLWSLTLFMLMVHLVPYMTDIHISSQNAANVLSLIGFSSIFGKIFFGNISSRLNPKLILASGLALQAIMNLWIFFLRGSVSFYIMGTLFGFAYGGVVPMFPIITQNFFGLGALGVLFGILMFAGQIGGAIGPTLGGYLFDRFGNYFLSFSSSLASVFISLILSLTLKTSTLRK